MCVWEDSIIRPCVSFNAPIPFTGKKHNLVGRYSAPHLSWASRRKSLEWFGVLPLLSFRWILGWLDFVLSETAEFSLWCVLWAGYIMTLKSWSALGMRLPSITIMQSIFITHLIIIIIFEVMAFHTVVIVCVAGCLVWLYHNVLLVT